MNQARPRAHRSRVDAAVDLGNEPPLSVDGGTGGVIDRRRVSAQWFSGTILTGVCGAALMGGAVFASLDGETNFATVPERVESTLRGAIGVINDKLAHICQVAADQLRKHLQKVRLSELTYTPRK